LQSLLELNSNLLIRFGTFLEFPQTALRCTYQENHGKNLLFLHFAFHSLRSLVGWIQMTAAPGYIQAIDIMFKNYSAAYELYKQKGQTQARYELR